jgi:dipeptide/tripeptide permease
MAEQKKQGGGGKQQQQQQPAAPETSKVISSRGKKVIAAGIVLLAVGFFILSKTDPQGQNWASIVSPVLIIASYALIGIGIVLPEKK